MRTLREGTGGAVAAGQVPSNASLGLVIANKVAQKHCSHPEPGDVHRTVGVCAEGAAAGPAGTSESVTCLSGGGNKTALRHTDLVPEELGAVPEQRLQLRSIRCCPLKLQPVFWRNAVPHFGGAIVQEID